MVNVGGMIHSPAYESHQKWAEPNKDHLKQLMREAFNNDLVRKEKGIKSRNIVKDNFNYRVVGERLKEAL
jgi:hypothetical protein